jgi:hypothetical protein
MARNEVLKTLKGFGKVVYVASWVFWALLMVSLVVTLIQANAVCKYISVISAFAAAACMLYHTHMTLRKTKK